MWKGVSRGIRSSHRKTCKDDTKRNRERERERKAERKRHQKTQRKRRDISWHLSSTIDHQIHIPLRKERPNDCCWCFEVSYGGDDCTTEMQPCSRLSYAFIPQIAIAIGVLTSNRGDHFGGLDVAQGCHCRVQWMWCLCWVPLQSAIVVCYGGGRGGRRPTLGEWTWCHCRVPL